MPRYLSDAIVELLRELGCRYVPLNPGSSFRGLHDSLVNQQDAGGPEPILCTNEGIAVAAAHAYAKATGEVGFVAVHDLVGLMQGTMGIYNAWCDRAAMVVLGGGGPMDPAQRRPIDWFHSATVQADLVRNFVKWDEEPTTASSTLDAIARAHRIAASEPRGPVYVTMDTAIQEQPADALATPGAEAWRPEPPSAARMREVEAVSQALLDAERPVIVTGRVGLDPSCSSLVIRMAELVGAGLHDERGLVSVPTDHRLNLTGDPDILREADVVLAVDVHDLNRLASQAQAQDGASPLIMDLSQGSLARRSWTNAGQHAVSSMVLPAHPRTGLEQLCDFLSEQVGSEPAGARTDRISALEQRHKSLRAAQRGALHDGSSSDEISPALLVDALWEAVREEPWLLTLRNDRSWPEGIWGFDVAGRVLGHSGGAGQGYGPGALLGGGLAARDREQLAVGVIGDGELQYGPGFLWSAVHYNVPMLVVVNNNRSYHNDEVHQIHMAKTRGRPVSNANIGIHIDDPSIDLAQLAQAYGAVGLGPLRRPEHLATVLSTAVEQVALGGVVLVDVHTTSEPHVPHDP